MIAVVNDGEALLTVASQTCPDAVITGVVMPRCTGIEATAMLVAARPESRVVLVTTHDDAELAERGYAAGAFACVLTLAAPRELLPAVRLALRGERYVSSRKPSGRTP